MQMRASGLITNAPYVLNLDCDHYINNSEAIREVRTCCGQISYIMIVLILTTKLMCLSSPHYCMSDRNTNL